MQITADETQKERGARLEADTAAGTLEARVDAVKGDPSLPMGRDDVLEKFARYGGAGPFALALLDCRGDTPFEEVWRLLR